MKRLKENSTGGTGFSACAREDELLINRRNLPHWQLPGSTYFITFRVKKGLFLANEQQIVLEAIKYFHEKRYWVTAAVVMPDHVHLLMQPLEDNSGKEYSLAKIIQSIKGFSAREINKSRGQRGVLWQDERFDRIVRDYDEFWEKWNYIRNNPIKVGLCGALEEYPFLWEPGENCGK